MDCLDAQRRLLEQAGVGAAPVVLDLGCGEGYFASRLAGAGARVVAADVAPEPLRRARAAHPQLELHEVDPDAPLPFADASFDLVWAGEVIQHVFDTAGWLSEVRRVLRSGATLALSVPDHGPLTIIRLAVSRSGFDAHFDPRSDEVRFYTPRTLVTLLEELGFQDVRVDRAGGVPGARRALLVRAFRRRF